MENFPLPFTFDGIHSGWIPILKKLQEPLLIAINAIKNDNIVPLPKLLFESLKYFGPDDVSVVIIGQDPYPNPQHAMGLAFSTMAPTIPPSLVTIFNCLEKSKLIRPHYKKFNDISSERIYCGDLRSWAIQGILLLNRALTTQIGVSNAHQIYWNAFTTNLVSALCQLRVNKPLIFLLWGNAARELEPIAKLYKHTCLCWTHPSPMANNKLSLAARFENSNHFTRVNEMLKFPICWDPIEHIYVATDGACKDNGGANARATFAVWIATGPLRNTTISGVVAPFTYKFRDPNIPSKGFEVTNVEMQPSNNRGEYLAWCWALLCLLRAYIRGRIDIISDCDLFIKTMTEWLPIWQSKNIAPTHKNYDLIQIADVLLREVRASCISLEMIHVNSHCTEPSELCDRINWKLNNRVDQIATTLCHQTNEIPGSIFIIRTINGQTMLPVDIINIK